MTTIRLESWNSNRGTVLHDALSQDELKDMYKVEALILEEREYFSEDEEEYDEDYIRKITEEDEEGDILEKEIISITDDIDFIRRKLEKFYSQ